MAKKKGPPATRALTGPFCHAPRKEGPGNEGRRGSAFRPDGTRKLCMQPAGWMTDHPGQGRCKWHGGNAHKNRIVHSRYSKITNRHVADIMTELAEHDADAMDLLPEAMLLRAMVIDYINRYDSFVEALMAWYQDPETKSRPRRVLDISDAAALIETISRVIHRVHQIQSEGAITLEAFRRVTENMGMIVATHVQDPIILQIIERKWAELVLDARAPALPPKVDSLIVDAESVTPRSSNS